MHVDRQYSFRETMQSILLSSLMVRMSAGNWKVVKAAGLHDAGQADSIVHYTVITK